MSKSIPRCEHPRPDLMRQSWQCLNGRWNFQFDPKNIGHKERWYLEQSLSEEIIVPFEVESELSGVAKKKPFKHFWYMKRFRLDSNLKRQGRLILHFEAVDYKARVWLNGRYLGEHVGGYTPFDFDITSIIVPEENVLAVRVYDSMNQKQVRGKQSSRGRNYGIWYTPVSGIWQPVWLERVGESYIKNYRAYPDLLHDNIRLELDIMYQMPGQHISINLFDPKGGKLDTKSEDIPVREAKNMFLRIEEPMLWNPEEPNLYRLQFLLMDESGNVVDEIESYLGIREVKTKDGKVWLNGKPLYQKLALVQGYYPQGNYSPATDDEFRRDLELLKTMGFNGLRVHQKIEAKRFYYWADKLGLIVWEEMPSMCSEFPSLLIPAGKKWRERFEQEWKDVIARDFNHPSIIVRVPFNESWGIWPELYCQSIRRWRTKIVKMTRELDPTRLVIDNSGWHHKDSDIIDIHHYFQSVEKSELLYKKLKSIETSTFPPRTSPLSRGIKYKGQPIIISEWGGFGFYKPKPRKNLLDIYREHVLAIGKYPYIQGYCYTQLYDVEHERNGLLDENRVPKVPLDEIKKINDLIH